MGDDECAKCRGPDMFKVTEPRSYLIRLVWKKRCLTRPGMGDERHGYKDAYRLCDIHGPEGLLIGLAQELS